MTDETTTGGLEPVAASRRRGRTLSFSSPASAEIEKQANGYKRRLERMSRQIASAKQSDVVSQIDVKRAADNIGAQVDRKKYKAASDIGALLGGASVATLLTMLITHVTLNGQAGVIVGVPLVAGLISYFYGLAGGKRI